jgi:hypothetical protein
MKLNVIQSPTNPTRLWLVDEATQEKIPGSGCFYPEQFTRPLKLSGDDRDRNFVAALKTWAHKLAGFASWQEAAATVAAVEDVEAVCLAYGTTLDFLFAQ